MHTTNAFLYELLRAKSGELHSLDESPRNSSATRSVHELIVANIEVASKMAFSMLNRWRFQLPKGDVESIAALALCEAANRFDGDRGVSFGTFLFSYVRGHLLKEITSSYNRKKRYVLVEEHSETDFSSACESLPTPEQALAKKELITLLKRAQKKLSDLEKNILDRCFAEDKTVVDVAKELGYSRGHVSRMKSDALELLSESFSSEPVGLRHAA